MIRVYKYAAIILAALLLLMIWYYDVSIRQWHQDRKTMSLDQSKMQRKIISIRDSAGREITIYALQSIQANDLLEQSTYQLQQLREDLDKAHLKLKNVKSSVQLSASTDGKISIGLSDTMQIKAGRDGTAFDSSLVSVPFSDSSDRFMKISGSAIFRPIESGFIFNKIDFDYSIKDTFTVTHVITGGLFKKAGVSLMVTSANPHTSIDKVQSYYVVVPKKWHQKWYVQAGSGLILGFILANKF